jgi:Secretion system C-terminal sorting domain
MKLFLSALLCTALSVNCIAQCPTPGASCTNSVNSGTISSLAPASVICITGGTVTIDGNIPNGAKVYINSSATLNLQNTNVFEGTIYNCGIFNQGNSNMGGAAFTINNYGTANLSNNGISLGSGDIINNFSASTINVPGNLLMDMGAKINNSGIISQSNAGASVNIKSGAEFKNMSGASVTTAGNFIIESGGKADNLGLVIAYKDININSGSLVYNQCTFHSYTKITISNALINDGLLLCDDPNISNPGPGMEKIEINGGGSLTNNKTVVGAEFLNSGIVTGNNGWFHFSKITSNNSSPTNFSGTNLIFYDETSTGNILDNGTAGSGVTRASFTLPTASAMANDCGNLFGILPLKLLNFITAIDKNNNVILSWEVENELNTGNYEIERSINGNSFFKATAISTADKKIEKVLYNEIQYGNSIYYRLKMTDVTGTVSYSKIVLVQLKNNSKTITSFYPNPVSNKLFVSGTEATYTMDLFNANGMLITSTKINNTQNVTVDFSNKPNGLYFIKFTYKDGSTENQKIIKQ